MLFLALWILLLSISLFALIKASDKFTDCAKEIGALFGISDFIIGVTIVSIGTSLPELISSIIAVLNNSSEIVIGNVLGSNITNIFLVLGVSAIVGRKIVITHNLVNVDLPLLVGSAIILSATVYNGIFSLFEALLCIAGFILYMSYTISKQKKLNKEKKKETKIKNNVRFNYKILINLVISIVIIYLGAKYAIDSVIKISEILNIGKEIIAASAIALGTSLPELIVCLSAAKKGNPEIAVGNILGSNIFNSFAVMGIPALIGSIVIPENILSFNLPILLIGSMLVATLLYFFIVQDKEITKWEGWLLVIFYFLYLAKLFN